MSGTPVMIHRYYIIIKLVVKSAVFNYLTIPHIKVFEDNFVPKKEDLDNLTFFMHRNASNYISLHQQSKKSQEMNKLKYMHVWN